MTRKPYLKESRYVTALCVWASSAAALIECMRYDTCYPESEVEANKIQRLINHSAEPADHIIRLIRVARTETHPDLLRLADKLEAALQPAVPVPRAVAAPAARPDFAPSSGFASLPLGEPAPPRKRYVGTLR